ncbi:MAG: helix-turn-helix domain-containing protein [bacterium]
MRIAPRISLSKKERILLEAITENSNEPSSFVEHARIVLMAADGLENQEIGHRLGISRQKVGRCRGRFAELGIEGIRNDAPRSGRPPAISKCKKTRTANLTRRQNPESGRWSRRKMAEVSGLSASTVGRIWQERGITPHVPACKPTTEEAQVKILSLQKFRAGLAEILEEAAGADFRSSPFWDHGSVGRKGFSVN